MEFQFSKNLIGLNAQLQKADRQETKILLSAQDDKTLWSLYQEGHEEALVLLFKKYHRQILVLVYNRLNKNGEVRLEVVKDCFGDFLEQILAGAYQSESIKKNFISFSVHHLSFLVRSKMKLTVNSKISRMNVVDEKRLTQANSHLRVEEKMDMRKLIDMIPKISNKVYRKVLWLIFILGYNSKDFTEIFGQREKAYDKRSRAMKAFRDLLEREGYLEELR